MRKNNKKLLRMALGTVFCLACMVTKHTAALMDPAQIRKLTKELQQLNLQIKTVEKTLKKLTSEKPISLLYKAVNKNNAQLKKQRARFTTFMNKHIKQQKTNKKYRALQQRLESQQLSLQYTKKLQQNMDAQQLDAPLGDIFTLLAQKNASEMAKLRKKHLMNKQQLEQMNLKNNQQLERKDFINYISMEQQISEKYSEDKKNIIQKLKTSERQKIFEQMRNELQLGRRLQEWKIQKLQINLKLMT